MKRYILILLAMLCLGVVGAHGQTYNGIDVSHHQRKIDWAEVAKDSAIQYVYIKATTGRTGTDEMYAYNNQQARKNGLKVGAYHYFSSRSSAHSQFEHFKQIASKENQDLIPMVDVEESLLNKWTKRQVQDSLQVFLDLCKAYYGKAPLIYGTQRSYNTYCAPRFNKYHLMIGRYSSNKPEIIGVGDYSIWQYSETGRIKGINRNVDLSRFNQKYALDILLLHRNGHKNQ